MTGFETLRRRLLDAIRLRIRNGEFTERALALRAGISQPHMHNLLKGVRGLNAEAGDRLMARLGMSALDLIDGDELRSALSTFAKNGELVAEVPVLLDRLGPDLPWPERVSPFERVPVPFLAVSRVPRPVVARLAEDPRMAPLLGAGALVLLDDSTGARASADPDALFAVERGGSGIIRWTRPGRGRLYLVAAGCRDDPARWEAVAASAGGSPVRARAIPLTIGAAIAPGSGRR